MKSLLSLGALAAAALVLFAVSPQANAAVATDGPLNGFIVGVQADGNGVLTRFAVSDSGGTVHEFTVDDSTEFGLVDQSGARWVSTFADSPAESVTRLRDHQERLAPVTVTSANGIATSVVERESGKLETNLGYLFAVFAVTWAAFFAYIFWISRKQRELQRELARVKLSIERASGRSQ